MADEKEDLSKKCAQTGTTLKRSKRYFRNGRYFINKAAFKAHNEKLQEEAKKAADDAAAAEPAAAKAEKPAEETKE